MLVKKNLEVHQVDIRTECGEALRPVREFDFAKI